MEVDERRIGWLMSKDIVIYIRPINMRWIGGKEGLGWKVTAERTRPTLIYVTVENEDLHDAIVDVCAGVRKKLGIVKKTRKRARRAR